MLVEIMYRKLIWFAGLAVTGVIMSNQTAVMIYFWPSFGPSLVNITMTVIFGSVFVILAVNMRNRGMVRWWHVLLIVITGAVLLPDQGTVFIIDVIYPGVEPFPSWW